MHYQRIFELNIYHDYYRDKICPDISIEPTAECSRILRGHRLILKNTVNGIVVIAPVDSALKSLVELAPNEQLSFFLSRKNYDLIEFTNVEGEPLENYFYRFSNEENTQIEASKLKISKFKLADQKLPIGWNIFGIVDIYNNSSLPAVLNQVSDYKITFQAKMQEWRYYLLTDAGSNGDEFLIEDKEYSNEAKIIFTRVEPETTDVLFSLIEQQFPQANKYLFKSQSPIACQESSRKNIQLLKKGSLGRSTVLIEHLPTPPNRNGVQVINTLKYL
ncbi:MAG: hypothetical protein ACFKPT_02920 [Gloeotrichia echinulata GP01]